MISKGSTADFVGKLIETRYRVRTRELLTIQHLFDTLPSLVAKRSFCDKDLGHTKEELLQEEGKPFQQVVDNQVHLFASVDGK